MDKDKKFYRLDISIAVEAHDEDEAIDVLVTDETMNQLKEMILNSKDQVKEIFANNDEDETPPIIN